MTELEIAVQDAQGARIAQQSGADRVELCAALGATGGLTPSLGMVESVVRVGLPVHVLIRPRPGGFVYLPDDIAVMSRDVALVLRAGASGVVIGALTQHNTVDLLATATLAETARATARELGRDVEVTFHRAIDVVEKPVEQLAVLRSLGVDRVLTSGQAPAAGDGLDLLREMVDADSGLEIMAGGGVTAATIPDLVEAGVHAVHLSGKVEVLDAGPTGPGGGTATLLEQTSVELVQAAANALR